MASETTRRVLNVFLASPGDVLEERDIATAVVNRCNKSFGPKFGWQIELHKWEDSKPAYGRPQGIINPAVDACDLFIGLLWERWGQPTGNYTSGFQEEFERAIARRECTGQPEIWLVFKAPRSDKLEDRGPELTRVMEFRETQRALRKVLFREIQNSEDWKSNLHDWLLDHVWERRSSLPEIAERTPAEPPPSSQNVDPQASTALQQGEAGAVRSTPEQLLDLANRVSRVVSSGDLEFSRAETNILGEFEIARLYLISSTWIARRYTSGFLGVHEINLLYKYRDLLENTPHEEHQLLRTVLHNSSSVVPGWFWLRDMSPEGVLEFLLLMARDRNSDLRVRALKLLASARISVPEELWTSLPLSDESEDVAAEAIRYLGFMGNDHALPLLKKASKSQQLSVDFAFAEARARILLRSDPKTVFSELVSNGHYVSAAIVTAFTDVADTFDTQDLVKGTENSTGEIKKFSVVELVRRGQLSTELAERLRQDDNTDIKQLALQALVNSRGKEELDKIRNEESIRNEASQGQSVALSSLLSGRKELDLDTIALNYYRTLDFQKLLVPIDWLSVDGPIAYEALALDQFDKVSELIYSDLDTGFERIRLKYLAAIKSELGDEAAERISKRLQENNLDDYVRRRYTEAALSGLAVHGRPSDVNLARRYLGSDDRRLQLAAVKVVAKFGDNRDVFALLEISDGAWGELEELAPATAIRLANNPLALAVEMAGAGGRGRYKAAIRWLSDQDSAEAKKYFRSLLDADVESTRVRGIHYLFGKLSANELRDLLDEYSAQETYYYNVVTWLDRLLYAPSPLREMFAHDLGQEVASSNTSLL